MMAKHSNKPMFQLSIYGENRPKVVVNLKLSDTEVDRRVSFTNFIKIDKYINRHTNIRFKCKTCGFVKKIKPYAILAGQGCSNCYRNLFCDKSIDESLATHNIKRIGNYKGARKHVKFLCMKCEYIWSARPLYVKAHTHGCPSCAKRGVVKCKTVDTKLLLKNIKRIGKYINTRTKMNVACLKCNHSWCALANSLLNSKNGCPACHSSVPEKLIKKFIDDNYTKYNKFVYHKIMIINNKKCIPDFYIETMHKIVIIEYNGEHHYGPVRFNGISEKEALRLYKRQIKRDAMLRKYCVDNSIILLEIPYYLKINEIFKEINNILK